jgi:hypothetical protein
MLPEHEQQMHLDEPTVQEQLLADLLGANEELLDALRMHNDLKQIGIERQAEINSRQETRMPRSVRLRDVLCMHSIHLSTL